MNTKTVISVKTDKATKEAANEVAKSMGLNLSVLINAYLKQVIDMRRVEFYAPEQMTPKLEKSLLKVRKEMGSSKRKSFSNVEDLLADLKN
ncbi:type II toxin-antitoxin system RelB/DinJ family antitoxin [Candidatus Kaiserbacteria bacterium]|nr:type II toxin-antitoxin system RelB/DinJ family antitoxin [Candidatus Kaiserbacteria bacterium]